MSGRLCILAVPLVAGVLTASAAQEKAIFEVTSAYHHIRVVDSGGQRTLCFDDAWETTMSIQNPLAGHFEYTEYFHLPWLWNTQIANVLMIGLGGASAQRSFEQYYTNVTVETVEIDPVVAQVAKTYFHYQESPRQQLHVEDGRVFLRRSTARHDVIILDAYVQGRYGSSLPQHLATREFFELTRDRLATNGVLAYNVIGNIVGERANLIGSIYRTLGTVFPQVYLFPARTSQNVVLLATTARGRAELYGLRQRAGALLQNRRVTLPGFRERLDRLYPSLPPNLARCPILTDDFAPVEGLAAADSGLSPPSSRSRATNAPAPRAPPSPRPPGR